MLEFGFNLTSSATLITIALLYARKKRTRASLHILILLLGVFWLPCTCLIAYFWGNTGRSFQWSVISMIWQASLLVIGLCVMYGSKTVHFFGRDLILASLVAIALQLAVITLYI